MATRSVPHVPMGEGGGADAAVQQPWRKRARLSSIGDRAEGFLERAGFDRAPWLTIALAGGITAWFLLPSSWQWAALAGLLLLAAIAAGAGWSAVEGRAHLRQAVMAVALTAVLGLGAIWARSAIVGAEPLDRPTVTWIDGRVISREDQPAQDRMRLVLAARDAEIGAVRTYRINVPRGGEGVEIAEGARVRLRARLMPPAPPMLPGAYNFARTAWFQGYAATGTAVGSIELIEPGRPSGLAPLQRALSAHVRSQLDGSAGTIASAFASGDRGAIAEADEEAMRDAGLTHLLSISGVHVSAVIAAAYLLAIRLLALWPWLALRVRLPILAAAVGAGAGIAYTLLTGAEVPTIRSCVGAVLVLIALALGREPLSMRMVAVAAAFVLLLWPESLVGPSFQMSFAAVIAIVALHESAPVRAFLAPREEGWLARTLRRFWMLLVTGFVIELALMPIVLFHFHRAGFYGAMANVVGIPLVTFVSMPLIALALTLDMVGAGAPAWWLAGQSLDLLIGIAHWTAAQPGAVKLMPQMGYGTVALFMAGGLWLALWRGKVRLWGLAASGVAAAMLWATPAPDVLVSGDGRHVGIAGEGDRLLVLREGRSDFARENLLELAGTEGVPVTLSDWPGARCSRDFCAIDIRRDGRNWHLLMARSRERVEERPLAAACERADIVIADRWLPRSCRPLWLKADRRLLGETGGLALYLGEERFDTVADAQGEHGWWRPESDRRR